MPDASPPKRSGFALTGPSAPLDPSMDAVRADLADIALAGRVFAPHFAASVPFRATRTAGLTAGRKDVEPVATLAPGDAFDVLELAGDLAWGTAPGVGLVGYVDAAALERVA